MSTNEFRGATVEEAIAQGLFELGITEEDALIETVSPGGFLSQAVVRVTPKITQNDVTASKEVAQKSESFIKGMLKFLAPNLEVSTHIDEDGITHIISGQGSGTVIGHRGEVLDALQYLALLVANKEEDNFVRVNIDAASYRQKRKNTLCALANRLARKAVENSRRVKVEPMNPYERRIIHFALQDNPNVSTVSEGEGKFRHVVIIPNEERPYGVSYGGSNFAKHGLGKTRKFGYTKRR
jgi:spoIIIJ-associated protein